MHVHYHGTFVSLAFLRNASITMLCLRKAQMIMSVEHNKESYASSSSSTIEHFNTKCRGDIDISDSSILTSGLMNGANVLDL